MADPSITRSTRTYILATLLATLAATALIAMFFVILCPAQVTFMVTHAWRSNSINDGTVSLHLSILANTSQRRTKVKFESIFIDLFNSSDPLGREDDWRRRINAHVDDMPDDYLKYPGNTSISVSAAAPSRTFLDFAPDWLIDDLGLTVTLMAQVHFKVGVVRTRLYGITVNCDSVVFPNQNDNTSSSLPREGRMLRKARPVLSPSAVNVKFPVTCHN
jgi:hypothetical protein